MSKYQLVLYPDEALRKKAHPVAQIDGQLNDLISAMAAIMYRYNGIGLAAPQVGYLHRVILADVGDGLLTLINPEILQSEGADYKEEGCLSLPEIKVGVRRKETILVRGIDRHGKEKELQLTGLKARVIQHEIDHLNGKLIIDYATTVEKFQLRDQLEQLEKRYRFQELTNQRRQTG